MSRAAVWIACACLTALAHRGASAGEAGAGKPAFSQDRLREIHRRTRPGIVIVRTETRIASGVVLDGAAGLVATSREALDAAGSVRLYRFEVAVEQSGYERVDLVEVGKAGVAAVHRSADAAILLLGASGVAVPAEAAGAGLPPEIATLPRAPGGFPGPGADVVVAGVEGAVRFDGIMDMELLIGKVAAPEGKRARAAESSAVALTAPTHMNVSGGPVLDASGGLVGIASFIPPEGALGAAVPLARLDELRSDPARHGLSAAEVGKHIARRAGPPPFLPVSPGPVKGKRVSFGPGVTAVAGGSRVLLLDGTFVLDNHDPLEYFAVPLENGKVHESVIAVDCDPVTLQVAMIGLGYRPGPEIERFGDTFRPLGDPVYMHVEWDWNEAEAIRRHIEGIEPVWSRPRSREVRKLVDAGAIKWEPGPRMRLRAEDLVFNRSEGRPMARSSWAFTGSGFWKDEQGRRHFRAKAEGVLAAVYLDPAAMFVSSLKDAELANVNPDAAGGAYYVVRDTMVPPRGTRCDLILSPTPNPGQIPDSESSEGDRDDDG